jgi:CubicO group peptidase (beta-lactamase class C family)
MLKPNGKTYYHYCLRKKTIFTILILLWLALSFSFANQPVKIPDKRFNEVRTKITQMIDSGKIPSLAVAVAKDGKIIWLEAFGWADREKKLKATPETIYPLASLSKSMMATGLMVLVDRGLVKLDDPVEKYIAPAKLKVYEGKSSDLKVIHLLSMTGGIPHGSVCYHEPHTPLPFTEFINRYIISVFPPGEVYEYSNYSMGVPQAIIANITGKSLKDFMSSEVFGPLGMKRSFVKYPPGVKNTAVKYYSDDTPAPHIYFGPLGGAGFYSSAYDLVKYGMYYLKNPLPDQKKIFRDEVIDKMHKVQYKHIPNAMMGLGWGCAEIDQSLNWIVSNGRIGGANSNISLVPSKNLAVVCLTNTSKSITDQMAIEIIDVLIPGFAEKTNAFIEKYETEQKPKSYKPTPQFIGKWEGKIKTYKDEIPVTMSFQVDGDIHIQLNNLYSTLLNNAGVLNNDLRGDFMGKIPNEQGFSYHHQISVYLKMKVTKLYGYITSYFETEKGNFAIPSYIYLIKKTSLQ